MLNWKGIKVSLSFLEAFNEMDPKFAIACVTSLSMNNSDRPGMLKKSP